MRQTIYRLVQDIQPFDTLEAGHRADALAWIKSGADIFRVQKPATPPKHLVSYFPVVDPAERRILMVDHIKAQKWLPAGGHVDMDEDPRATVIREAAEELSLTAEFLAQNTFFISQSLTVGLTAGHTDVSLWFVLKGNSRDGITYDPSEFNTIRWFAYDDVLKMDAEKLDPHMHRFMEKWMGSPG